VGTTASGTADIEVAADGSLISTTLQQNAYLGDGGTAVSTFVGLYAQDQVGDTDGYAVVSGGEITVVPGGSTVAATILGGYVLVSSGASTFGTTVDGGVSGGYTYGTSQSATASGTVAFSKQPPGGNEVLLSGASADSTTLSSGGTQTVRQGASATSTTTESGGYEQVSGVTMDATVNPGGTEFIDDGGVASGTMVNSGGRQFVGGSAFNTTVSTGGREIVYDGVASNSRIDDGLEIVSGGGAVTVSAAVLDGGYEDVYVYGRTTATTLSGATSEENVSSGGTAVMTTVGGLTDMYVYSGAIAISTLLLADVTSDRSNGGSLFVAGGTASDTMVAGVGSVQDVYLGGVTISSTVSSGAEELIRGGMASGTAIQLGGKERVTIGGTTTGVTVTGGVQAVGSGGAATGTTVNSGGYQTVSSGQATSTTVTVGGTLSLDSGGVAVDIALRNGGMIDLLSLPYIRGGSATLNPSTDILTVTESGVSSALQLAGSYAGGSFQLGPDAGTGTLVTLTGVPCYCRGTLIRTDAGEVAVEALRVGDHLLTRAGDLRPVTWIGRRSYAGRFASHNRAIQPVLFRAGSLADGVPQRDLLVSPLHAMYLDGVLIQARTLVNGTSIRQLEAMDPVEYVHVELQTHDVIYAEGATAETFLDDDSRDMFHNASEYRALHPEPPMPARYCAPRVEDGYVLEAVRARLAARASQPDRRPMMAKRRAPSDRLLKASFAMFVAGPE
jgi:autotransporter passenger strand-loop-strand repeat protein